MVMLWAKAFLIIKVVAEVGTIFNVFGWAEFQTHHLPNDEWI